VGTIIEGPTEYFSGRLKKKERKQTIVDEILADKRIRWVSKEEKQTVDWGRYINALSNSSVCSHQ